MLLVAITAVFIPEDICTSMVKDGRTVPAWAELLFEGGLGLLLILQGFPWTGGLRFLSEIILQGAITSAMEGAENDTTIKSSRD